MGACRKSTKNIHENLDQINVLFGDDVSVTMSISLRSSRTEETERQDFGNISGSRNMKPLRMHGFFVEFINTGSLMLPSTLT
jgi:hypothetical protein